MHFRFSCWGLTSEVEVSVLARSLEVEDFPPLPLAPFGASLMVVGQYALVADKATTIRSTRKGVIIVLSGLLFLWVPR